MRWPSESVNVGRDIRGADARVGPGAVTAGPVTGRWPTGRRIAVRPFVVTASFPAFIDAVPTTVTSRRPMSAAENDRTGTTARSQGPFPGEHRPAAGPWGSGS